MIEEWVIDNKRTLLIIGGMAIGGALAPYLIPALATWLGFGAGGVASGSIAALVHSVLGNVAAGSLFAALQTIGATGAIGLGSVLASMGFGALLGKALDFIAPYILRIAQTAMLAGGNLASHLAGALNLLKEQQSNEAFQRALAKRIRKD
jgi:hypothetical protein